MQFLHAKEKQVLISGNNFSEPEQVDLWVNAESIKIASNIDGLMYACTQSALYLIDGFCDDMQSLFDARFKFEERS